MCILPRAPFASRLIANGGFRIAKHGGIGVDERQVPQVVGNSIGEPLPLSREDLYNILGDPFDLTP